MTFIKHHKHHFGVFIILIIIAVVSGYFAFGTPDIDDRMQNADNRIQTVGDTVQDTTNTVSDAENKKQITENKKNDLTPTATLSTTTTITTSSTPAVEASGLTAGQAIQQLSTPVTVRIDNKNYQTEFTSSTTAYDLMAELKSDGKITFSGKEYSGMGFFVEEINDVKNDNLAGKYWIYYVNGQSAQVGVSNYFIKPNDLIEWKYENAKF